MYVLIDKIFSIFDNIKLYCKEIDYNLKIVDVKIWYLFDDNKIKFYEGNNLSELYWYIFV